MARALNNLHWLFTILILLTSIRLPISIGIFIHHNSLYEFHQWGVLIFPFYGIYLIWLYNPPYKNSSSACNVFSPSEMKYLPAIQNVVFAPSDSIPYSSTNIKNNYIILPRFLIQNPLIRSALLQPTIVHEHAHLLFRHKMLISCLLMATALGLAPLVASIFSILFRSIFTLQFQFLDIIASFAMIVFGIIIFTVLILGYRISEFIADLKSYEVLGDKYFVLLDYLQNQHEGSKKGESVLQWLLHPTPSRRKFILEKFLSKDRYILFRISVAMIIYSAFVLAYFAGTHLLLQILYSTSNFSDSGILPALGQFQDQSIELSQRSMYVIFAMYVITYVFAMIMFFEFYWISVESRRWVFALILALPFLSFSTYLFVVQLTNLMTVDFSISFDSLILILITTIPVLLVNFAPILFWKIGLSPPIILRSVPIIITFFPILLFSRLIHLYPLLFILLIILIAYLVGLTFWLFLRARSVGDINVES